MGGDDSQKLLPRRGVHSSPGRKPPAQLTKSTISLILAVGLSRGAPWTLGLWPQLQPAWVIFGKHRWVNSGARRSSKTPLNPTHIWIIVISNSILQLMRLADAQPNKAPE